MRSSKIMTKNGEMVSRCIAYNMYRHVKLVGCCNIVSIEPIYIIIFILLIFDSKSENN
jgi:hypothetical protein